MKKLWLALLTFAMLCGMCVVPVGETGDTPVRITE